jgi:hypothetical protein
MNANITPIGWCETCQKNLYTDKARAKAVARLHQPRKAAYRCRVPGQEHLWHVGSVPRLVRRGFLTRDQYLQQRDPSSDASTAENWDTS